MNENKMEKLDSVVIRFSGDSGDGMQLTGTLFSSLSAILGNEIATFPDYPAEIRAPQGTVSGVSGFQVKKISKKRDSLPTILLWSWASKTRYRLSPYLLRRLQ